MCDGDANGIVWGGLYSGQIGPSRGTFACEANSRTCVYSTKVNFCVGSAFWRQTMCDNLLNPNVHV